MEMLKSDVLSGGECVAISMPDEKEGQAAEEYILKWLADCRFPHSVRRHGSSVYVSSLTLTEDEWKGVLASDDVKDDAKGTSGVRTSARGVQAADVMDWRAWGDADYIAARRLLLDEFLIQGACLANTAIEKYIKAILVVQRRRIPRSHDPLVLYRRIAPGGTLVLDEKFLGLLVKVYQLRYPDDLAPGFNIVLSQALILDALDQTVFQIRGRFQFRFTDGKPATTLFDTLLESKDARILTNNTALGTISQEELFNRPSAMFAMRVLDNGGRLEARYQTEKLSNLNFDAEGIKPNN